MSTGMTQSSNTTTVAVLGTGVMGFPMARNLAKAGHAVRAWNRSADKAAPLAEHGVAISASVADAVTGADAVVTMLLDADAVLDVMRQAAGTLHSGVLWLQMSTVGVEGQRRLHEWARDRQIAYVDAPVLGTRAPAEQAQLVVIASGSPNLRERCDQIFAGVARATRWVGDEPGAASAMKLVVNFWVLSLTDAVGQAIALARALNVEPQEFLDIIEGGATDSPYAHVKGGAILAGEFVPSFTVDNAGKDARLIAEAAHNAGVDGALADAIVSDLRRASELGHGGDDMAAVYFAHEKQ